MNKLTKDDLLKAASADGKKIFVWTQFGGGGMAKHWVPLEVDKSSFPSILDGILEYDNAIDQMSIDKNGDININL